MSEVIRAARVAFVLATTVGCAEPSASSAKIPIFKAPNAISASCGLAIDPARAKKIFDALFPAYLTSKTQCRPREAPSTWSEIDDAQAENFAAGQFVPTLLSAQNRAAAGEDFVIAIDNCEANTFGHVVYASFAKGELERANPKPTSRREDHPDANHTPRCAADTASAPTPR